MGMAQGRQLPGAEQAKTMRRRPEMGRKPMINCRTALFVSSGIAALLATAPAFAAQEAAGEVQAQAAEVPSTAEGQEEGGDLIVVTAQKRTQVLIDVPQSITVVSGATLENQQANSFQDYLKLVPGLQLDQSNPGEGRLILRGLNTGGVASTVAVYLDETPFGSSTGLVNGAVLAGDFDTFDVARVEVLRGPQGTLYGASSLGGLLKFVTNEPDTTKVEARGRVSLEDTKGGDLSYRGHAVVNIPLSDTIAFRASGTYRNDGGFIDSNGDSFVTPIDTVITSDDKNNINRVKSYGGRASILFKPSDVFDLRLSAYLQNIRTKSPTIVESDPDTLESLYDGPTQHRFAEPYGDLDYRVYNALLNYDLGFGTLTSSTSFSKQNQTRRQDLTFNLSWLIELFSGVPNELVLDQNTNSKKFTQEIRLTSHDDDRFEWLVGGYYTHEDGLILQEYVTLAPGTKTEIITPLGVLAEVSLDSKYKEIAGFANATIHLGQQFHLDFGGRYSHNNQDAAQTGIGALAGGLPINTDLESSDNVFTYSVAPRYEINDHASVYARIAKGYRPGGPNVLPPNPPAGLPTTFDPDTATTYELGFKGETADRRASLDVAIYHISWNDIQLVTSINNFGLNINGGNAKSDGAEFTATWRPIKGLSTSINGAYTNARLADDLPPVGGQVAAFDGDRLPFTPKFSLGVNADYNWSLGGTTEAFVGGSLRALSKQTADYDADFFATNDEHRKVDGYSVVDLRGGVDFGRFSVEAYAKNLFDAHGKTSAVGPNANGAPIYPNGAIGTGVIRPRTIGLSLTASY
jgi:outer membrane receptor protein involved in Fe transport